MFYTGNDYNGGYHNSVGVAFNNRADGEWKRLDIPVIPYGDGDSGSGAGICRQTPPALGRTGWGAGQPSATNIGNGRVLLFWTYRRLQQ